jgi:glycosyltransferase involved in cell wall biosynthesis
LIAAFFLELASNPVGLGRGIALWLRLCANKHEVSPRMFAYLLQACHFRRKARVDGITHVHAHFATNPTAVAMLAHVMGGPSYSFTAHGPDEFVDTASTSVELKIQRAAFVLAISQFCRVQLVRASGMEYWEKIRIAHCGLPLEDFTPEFTFSEENHDFVCIGRICPQKGQLLIPPAIALVRTEFPNVRVHFVGDGESRVELENAASEYGVAQHVVLHGWQHESAVKQLLAGSRALLLPSFAEGLPIVIMEAFALGRPVLSTFIAGIPELLDNKCGWIFPAGSVQDLAAAMRSALRAAPAVLVEKAREGRARVEQRHDLRTLSPDLRELFARHSA